MILFVIIIVSNNSVYNNCVINQNSNIKNPSNNN